MLTKQDLEAIRLVVRDESKLAAKEEIKSFKQDVQDVKNGIEDIEIKLEEKSLEVVKQVFLLRAELKEDIKNIKRGLNRMYKTQELIIKFFNEEAISIKKQIEKIQDRINISQN